MKTQSDFHNRMKNRIGYTPSESKNRSTGSGFMDWNKLYSEMKVEDMPWFLPELDPDLREALNEKNLHSGSFLDLGTGPGTQAIELSKLGFEVTGSDISSDAISKAQELNDHVKFIEDNILDSQIDRQFDYIFDRGCFHVINEDERTTYVSVVSKLLQKEGILFMKCFSDKNEYTGYGPHLISREQIEAIFSPQFDILQIKDSVYQSTSSQEKKTLFVVMKKK